MNVRQRESLLNQMTDAGIDTLGLRITRKGRVIMEEPAKQEIPTKPGMPKALLASFDKPQA